MRILFCYESVIPAKGGAEHYISDLARSLDSAGHEVHLIASRWDATALPTKTIYHPVPTINGPRFLRPWRFANRCLDLMQTIPHDVSVGFDKTFGQDILYPQGGLHSASRYHNLLKYPQGFSRTLAKLSRAFDPTSISFARLERRQYITTPPKRILVNSQMVQRHFREYLNLTEDIHILYSSIDPSRFEAPNREELRQHERTLWNVKPEIPVGLFVAMNYRLKGLAQLLHAVAKIPENIEFTLIVVGHAKFLKYHDLATRLGILNRVIFLGFRANPKDAFFGADFLVHPTFYDPCSLVALEALGCGLPVITTQYNGASEFLPPESGLVVRDPHNADELSRAIVRLCDSNHRNYLSQKCLGIATRFTWENHFQQMVKHMEEVVALKLLAK